MSYYRKIIGEKCYLAPVTIEDADQWAAWLNMLEVTLPLGDEAYGTIFPANMREWIEHIIKNHDPVFNIVDLATDKLLGRCLLFSVNHVDRTGHVGIFIGDQEYRGKGYGTEALKLLLDFGFNLLNLNNIMLGVFSYNERALNCYKKVGFKEIGRRRQARVVGGEKYDAVLMDMLSEEFESVYVKKVLNTLSRS
ncbi:MAG: GNAT family N-acetyltransferase [Clostridia bacterium]|nr:GNAT family N-acetyltransferase [Clostridia bacterium]